MTGIVKVDEIQNNAGTTTLAKIENGQLTGVLSPATGFRNRIINGDMRIDQRNAGASVTPASSSYTLDRWQAIQTAASSKFSVQQNAGSVTPPVGFTKYLGVTSLSAYSVTATDFYQMKQLIEGFNVTDLAYGTANAQPITVSFLVRSSLTGNFGLVISWGSSGSNQRSYPVLYPINSANTWEYKTITIEGDTTMPAGGFETGNGSGMQLRFSLGGGAGNAGTPDAWATANSQTVIGDTSVVGTNGATFFITGVQLEKGAVATPFEFRSIGQELGLCQRYFQLTRNYVGAGTNSTTINGMATFPVTMRAIPTFGLNGVYSLSDYFATDPAQSSVSIGLFNGTTTGGAITFGNFSGVTAGRIYFSRFINSNAITLSAEL